MMKFDFNNMMSAAIGATHGVMPEEIAELQPAIDQAVNHIKSIAANPTTRVNVDMEWLNLAYQDEALLADIQKTGERIANNFKNVLFLGIGGSYLGLLAAQDACAGSYYNEFESVRGGKPRIFFEGKNLDPATLHILLRQLKPEETFVVVISKSGETTETRAAFDRVQAWLKASLGDVFGRQIVAITDPKKGSLRGIVAEQQARDEKSFKSFPLFAGVGGRFSEFNMGLLHLAILGIDIKAILGALSACEATFTNDDIWQNPAYLYAILNYILSTKKGKDIAILMPFSEKLKTTADWYIQLLAESLGKKYARTVTVAADGSETWAEDTAVLKQCGRTPIACCGTPDLHSVHQNNTSGANNKIVTFIRLEQHDDEVIVPETGHFLGGKSFATLLNLAAEAAEWSLTREERPNCTISIDRLTPEVWAQLLFFFEMATAFEGELLGVNAFNQPGVEGYKNFMYYRLGKPGLKQEIIDEIAASTFERDEKYIVMCA